MKYRLLKNIAMAVSVSLGLGLAYFWCFPIMEVVDGCDCGQQRKWYEMPNSPWENAKLHKRIEVPGDPTHKHQYWDAQWGVWFEFPWQK
jgi:hypothetical protein